MRWGDWQSLHSSQQNTIWTNPHIPAMAPSPHWDKSDKYRRILQNYQIVELLHSLDTLDVAKSQPDLACFVYVFQSDH